MRTDIHVFRGFHQNVIPLANLPRVQAARAMSLTKTGVRVGERGVLLT
jgi:hypothetical protein